MEKKLPKNWVETNLPETVFFQEGPGLRKFQYREEGIPFLNIRTIVNESVDVSLCGFLDEKEVEEKYQHFLLEEGDIICSTSGTIGKTALITKDLLPLMLNTSIIRFRTKNANIVNNQFIYYFLKSKDFLGQALEHGTGTAQLNVGPSHLNRFYFNIPPLPEQERIVAKLDLLFAQHEKMKIALEKIPQILKDFRQQVLTQAVTGKLTEEWRKDKNLEEWKLTTLNDIAYKITDGAHNTPTVFDFGFPYLMAKDLTGGFLDFTQKNFIDEKDHRELYNKCKPEIGDLLIVNIGAGTGNNVIVDVNFEFSFKNIAIVKPKRELINTFYLKHFFDKEKVSIMVHNARGGAQPFLSLRAIKEIQLHLPSIQEQTEIVSRVESFFKKVDAIELRYQKLKEKIDQLPQTILHKAFKGELVPQLPTDGDAKDLLKEVLELKKVGKKK